jgi:hypothetical protein
MNTDTEDEVKTQVITEITLGSILVSAINGIIGFIAVYFFKPVWEKLIKYWKDKI